MKKTSRIVTSLLSINLILSNCVLASPIHRYTEEIPISNNITLHKVQDFYAGHDISYSYIKADLSDGNTSLKLLTSQKGTDVLETVENLTKPHEDVVAALNADFFSTVPGGKALSLGIQIENGNMSQSPINPSTMATVSYIDKTISMSYLDFKIIVTADSGESHEVRHLNKHTSYYGDILLYTPEINGGMSPAPGGDVVEVVVSNGKVVEFRRNLPSTEIPKDGCVLVVSEGSNMFLANNFAVGDNIKIEYFISPSLENAEAAFGGGAMLVENGKKPAEYSHVISGYHPRSAIGIDQSGQTLYLVAVNGRQEKSRGMSMSELSDLMLSLGCYNAVNLDGGGSTNMQASTIWDENIHTENSPTENRKVINAVGLIYSNKSDAIPKGISLKPEKDVIFIDDSVKIASAVYDENLRPIPVQISWSSEFGNITDGIFTPAKAGKAVITAKSGDITESTEVFVIDTISGIDTKTHLRLNVGDTSNLDINVFDNDGHYTKVNNTKQFEITSSDSSVVLVKDNNLTAIKNGQAIISVKKDSAVTYISVAVGIDESSDNISFLSAAPNNYFKTDVIKSDNKLVVGALNPAENTLLTRLLNKNIITYLNTNTNSVILSDSTPYALKEDDSALYITLNTSNGGIRKTDSSQWDKLVSAISSTNKNNVFLLSGNSIFGSLELENKVISDYLSGLNKNVFVITRGERNSYKNINGVKYFTLGNHNEEALSLAYIKNCQTLEFHFSDAVTFEWKSIY